MKISPIRTIGIRNTFALFQRTKPRTSIRGNRATPKSQEGNSGDGRVAVLKNRAAREVNAKMATVENLIDLGVSVVNGYKNTQNS